MKKIAGILAVVVLFQTSVFAGPGPEKKITISPNFKLSPLSSNVPANAPGARKVRMGRGMTIGGGILLVGGIALAANALPPTGKLTKQVTSKERWALC